MENLTVNFKKIVEKYKYFVIVILIGICMMIISPLDGSQKEMVINTSFSNFSTDTLQTELEDILAEISGVGRVKVLLNVGGGISNVYATDITDDYQKKGDDVTRKTTEEIVFSTGSGGLKEPIKLTDNYPKYLGALIVCDGADDALINLQIIKAVSAICDISSDKITILKMKV